MISIEIRDEELKKRLAQVIREEPRLVRMAVKKGTLLMWQKSQERSPTWRGDLRKSMSHTIGNGGLEGIVRPGVKYAEGVHYGTKPHMIGRDVWGNPSSDFSRWATEHGIPPFVLARSIARKGTKPNPWMKEAFEAHKQTVIGYFQDAVRDSVK